MTSTRRPSFDLLSAVMAFGVVTAIAALAYPAFRGNPTSAPGLVLILTVGAIALIGLFGFRRATNVRPSSDAAIEVLDAMAEPAALVWDSGQILAFNAAWAEANGATNALPRGKSAQALYMAFAQARKGEPGRAIVMIGQREVEVVIGRAGEGRFLMRAAPDAVLPIAAAPLPALVHSSAAAATGEARAMAAGAPFGSAVIAGDDLFAGRAQEANPALAVLTGPAAARDAAFGDLFDPSGVAEARAKLAAGSSGPIELVARAYPDKMLHLYVAPEGERRRIWLFDVSAQKSMELQLNQAQKMQAVGQLAGGVAHDFNNLLTVVTGNIDMAKRALDAAGVEDARARRSLDNAMKGAERAASLTQRLLAFSRRQPLAPKPLDVDKLATGMADLLQRALGEHIQLEIVTAPGLWRVEADPNQLESAVLNLAVNARDAMPDGGRLTIETANARLDEGYAASQAEVPPGQYVMIAVTDTGTGMPRQVIERAFEPFFTTKEVGKGSGLGLSMIYGFVKQSGGHVKIYSEEGEGTTIKLYLPRLMREPEGEEEPVTISQGLEGSRREETILVVEDDDDVRAYTVECLRELGYRVLEAHDGASALRLLERQEAPIDLLFTDVVMPGMTGRELADAARERQSDLRVLYTSGYTRNAIVHAGRLDAGVEIINKPFTYEALARKVRDMLDGGRTECVLIAEAESTVRMLAAEALGGIGFRVEEAATGAEALNKVRAAQGRYDSVVLDDGLGDYRADTLARELRALHEQLAIVIVSTDRVSDLEAQFADDRCTRILPRPYSGGQLQDALKQLGVSCAGSVERERR